MLVGAEGACSETGREGGAALKAGGAEQHGAGSTAQRLHGTAHSSMAPARLAVPLGRLRRDVQGAEQGAQPLERLPAERRLQQLGALRREGNRGRGPRAAVGDERGGAACAPQLAPALQARARARLCQH